MNTRGLSYSDRMLLASLSWRSQVPAASAESRNFRRKVNSVYGGVCERAEKPTEDHVFYPMARKTLGEEEMGKLSQEFARQKEKEGPESFEKYHKIVVDLGAILTHLR
jgi:hypothetical protein